MSEGDTVTVDAKVQEVGAKKATVTRSASVADVVQEPRDVLDSTSFDTDFELYDRLLEIDPELSGAIRGQSQLASGFKVIHPAFDGDNEAPTEKERTALKECRRLVDDLSLELQQPSIFARMIAMGNDINKIVYSEGVGIKKLQSLPLRAVTILDDDTETQTKVAKKEARDAADSEEEELDLDVYKDKILDTSVQSADWYVLNEGYKTEKKIPAYKILHFSVERRSNWWEDRFGRETYGVWGVPRIEPTKFTLQAKHNTLTNKVAMDDSLIAREVYKIDIETLFGHIKNDEERQDRADDYTEELKEKLENMGPGERPILPEEVTVEVKGPNGKAKEHGDFLNLMNDSIMHALTFHVGGVGRDAGGPMIGNRPAKDVSMNNVAHLRKVMGHSLRELFQMHLKLKFADKPAWVDKNGETGDDPDISKWTLDAEVVLPRVKFDPLEDGDQERVVNQATKAYNSKLITRNEGREMVGLDPLPEDELDKLFQDMEKTQEINQKFQQDDSGESGDDDDSDGSDSSSDSARSANQLLSAAPDREDSNSGLAATFTQPMEDARDEIEETVPEGDDE